jgi:hypothetical protein
MIRLLPLACLGLLAIACAPKIGDSCDGPIDCSITGDRVCDLTQPGGYCTVRFCSPDTCPDNAVCVEWTFDPPRTATTWCMKRCSGDGGCRSAYRCMGADDPALVDAEGRSLARIADLEARSSEVRFCAAAPPASGALTEPLLWHDADTDAYWQDTDAHIAPADAALLPDP